MKSPVLLPVMAGAIGLMVLSGNAQAQSDERGRVISSTPVVQQVAVPREVCRDEAVPVASQKSGAGALIGGIAGGAMGNAVGNGGGRALATMIGLVGGAIVGDRIEGGGQTYTRVVRQCGTQTTYENRTVAYNVVYEYAGKQYSVQMPQDPGRYVRLNVTPVDAIEPPPPAYPAPTYYPARPQVQYVPAEPTVSTRVVIGTQIIPTYPVAPRVVYVDGHRPHPGAWSHDRPWDRGERWERGPDRGWR